MEFFNHFIVVLHDDVQQLCSFFDDFESAYIYIVTNCECKSYVLLILKI
jgi:hypothetical protein